MYQCYYQTDYNNPKTRCQNRQDDCWCNEEHRIAWQKENYQDIRQRGLKQLTPKELQVRLLDIQLKELRKKWKKAQDMFEKAEIENHALLIKQKQERLKNEK